MTRVILRRHGVFGRGGALRSVCLGIMAVVVTGFAHGTKYEILPGGIIGIRAMFDTGEPMANARVLIFAPGETEVKQRTVTDEDGIFCLVPDKSGTWAVQVRAKGGHGMRINLDIDSSMAFGSGRETEISGPTFGQKIIMAVCFVWGCVGTALFFGKRAKA